MTSPRPSQRRVLAGLLRVLLVAGVLPLMAPTCGSLSPGTKTFSRRSLIIPMDLCYQYQTDQVSDSVGGYKAVGCPKGDKGDPGDVIKAYGLVYQLIRNNIAVYWVIAPGKTTATDVDMSIQYNGGPPALKYDWTNNTTSSTAPSSTSTIEYRGGPFVIDGSDYAAALSVLNANKGTFSGVNIHVSNVAFQGFVAKTMAGGWTAGGTVAPKLALLDIGSSNMPCTGRCNNTYVTSGGKTSKKVCSSDSQCNTGDTCGSITCGTAKNSEIVIQGYLTRAGLDTADAAGVTDPTKKHGAIFDRLFMDDFLPDSSGSWTTTNLAKNGYQVLWVPHWEAPGSCSDCPPSSSCTCQEKYGPEKVSKALKSIGAFSAAGKDLFAECAGLGSFEGVQNNSSYENGDVSTRFQTLSTPGLSAINKSVAGQSPVGSFSSPLMQIGDFPFIPRDGAIQNYKAGTYKTETVRLITDSQDSNYDIFTMLPSTTSHGTVVYLAGHSYSGSDGAFEVAGSRLVLNTLFNLGASCQNTGVACSTGLFGECAQGVMRCNSKGESECVPVKSPQPETCDGKDNNCDGVVDNGLDVACYDGPASSVDSTGKPRGICQAGVSSCVQVSPGKWGMSACLGEVLPSDHESCNGLDNDCDGTAGNEPGLTTPLTQACYTGPSNTVDSESGFPRGICKAGLSKCQGGAWTPCTPCTDPTNGPPPWRDVQNPAYADCEILPHTQICTTNDPDASYDMTCTGVIACTCNSSSPQPSCYDGPPETRGVGNCTDGKRVCTSNHWGSCTGQVLPRARDCSDTKGDNDCNGKIDSTEDACKVATCPPANLRVCPSTGAARYVSTDTIPAGKKVDDPKGRCTDGVRSCKADGSLGDCEGTIYPAPEICDGLDNNCDGQADENPDTLCSAGNTCVHGVCVKTNCGPENWCPEGYTCNDSTRVCERGNCPSGSSVVCADGQVCQFDTCRDPCAGVACPQGSVCSSGFCTGGGCYLQGCGASSGKVCVQGQCEPDPCNGVACPVGTFCRAGDCVQSCAYVTCPADQICSVDGFCETDPCRDVTCAAGKACVAGTCQDNPCSGKACGPRQVCKAVDGKAICQDDPCSVVSCPVGACSNGQCYPVTARDSSQPTPIPSSSDSSGGCGCGNGGGGGLGALLLGLLLPLLRRGSRRPFRPGGGGRAALLGLAALITLSAAACKGGSSSSSSGTDYSTCTETCGENQCIDLNYDPAHCGHCGTVCDAGELCRDGFCGPSTAVAPYVREVSPDQANHGLLTPVTVTLTGDRFQAGASVRAVYGTSSKTFTATRTDASHLEVTLNLQDVPATQVALRVVNPDHVISNGVPFDVVDVAPSISSVTPAAITTGAVTTLTVKGTGFASTSICHVSGNGLGDTPMATSTATVDGAPALSCLFDGTPTAVTPGTYSLTVVNGTASSNALPLTVKSPTPTLATISPSQGDAGAAVEVSLSGSGFDRTSQVYFQWGTATDAPSTEYLDATHLLVTGYVLPSAAGQATVTATVTVRNGSTVSTNSLTFRAVQQTGSIQVTRLDVAPSPLRQGQSATLTFGGSGFTTVKRITVVSPTGASIDAAAPTSASNTTAVATVALPTLSPEPAGTYNAFITFASTTTGQPDVTSPSFQFDVLSNVAVLQSISPAGAAQGTKPIIKFKAGNIIATPTPPTVTLSRQGAVAVTATLVGLQPLTTTDPTLWQGTLDLTGLNTGTYGFAVQNAGAAKSNEISFTVLPGMPTITSLSPACAVQGDAPTTITINGTNFALPDAFGNTLTQVMYSLNGTTNFQVIPATVTVNSASKITVVFDTRNAVANVTYYISVWNPNDPITKNAQHSNNATFKVAASSCQ